MTVQSFKRPSAICLMGPTASGKTALTLDLAQTLPCTIISVDSAQVYRGMDIGTAKPDAETLARVPHHLIDMLEPEEAYSAARFRKDALALMSDIIDEGRIPLLTGGTMLYFKTLLYGIDDLPAANPAVRDAIERQAREQGWEAVHRRLAVVDPETAARLHPGDRQRVQRALEVYLVSGKPLSQWQRHGRAAAQKQPGASYAGDLPCHIVTLALAPHSREALHDRIAARFLEMLEGGLVEEVRALRRRGTLHPDLPAIRAVGYRQVWSYLDGELDYQQMVERGIIATRQLAKRQLTWLRSWQDLHWLWTDDAGQKVVGPAEVAGMRPQEVVAYYLQNG